MSVDEDCNQFKFINGKNKITDGKFLIDKK
jgi:hypothetical protein